MLDPPIPISATWLPPTQSVELTFNHPLIPAVGSPTGVWEIVFGAIFRVPLTVTIAANQVKITTAPGLIAFGANRVSYAPPPQTVTSNTARQIPAAAFTIPLLV